MMKTEHPSPELTNPRKFTRIFLGLGFLGLLIFTIGLTVNPQQFWFSGLLSLIFWTTLGLGGLFFVLIHHATGAVWSVNIRRMAEAVMTTLPWMLLFALPVLRWGIPSLFEWSSADALAHNSILAGKSGYLNASFFSLRTIVYFVIWLVVAQLLYRNSLKQDTGENAGVSKRLKTISAPSIVLFALSLTFFGFDWVMSIDPLWYSTIFGVYIFSGSYLVILAFLIILNLNLRSQTGFRDLVTVEHYHDLGKLLFAFTVFWGYIGGSQYFFIWYANIPEETVWYLHRWEHGWKIASLFLIVGHFALPFFTLIFRAGKRNLRVLGFMAGWMIFMHYVDLYWLIMPNFHQQGPVLSWMDFASFIGIGGIFLGIFWHTYSTHTLLPVGDPDLKKSIEFINR